MIDQQPTTAGGEPELAEVLRLTDQQRAVLAPYVDAVRQAQQVLANAVGLILVGRGVDLDRHEARLSADAGAVLLVPRPPAEQGG